MVPEPESPALAPGVCPFCGTRHSDHPGRCPACDAVPVVDVDDEAVYRTVVAMCGPECATDPDPAADDAAAPTIEAELRTCGRTLAAVARATARSLSGSPVRRDLGTLTPTGVPLGLGAPRS
jgi:hypothetical protein